MLRSCVAISVIIFALVAIGHLVRIVQDWPLQLAGVAIAMSVSWIGLVVSVALGERFYYGGEGRCHVAEKETTEAQERRAEPDA